MSDLERTQRRIGKVMIYLAWLILLALLTLFFQQWLEKQDNPNQDLASYTSAEGVREVVLRRNRSGHYISPGLINGRKVRFLLDTGASYVSIPAGVAERLGLEYGPPLRSQTANGIVTVYATVAAQVALGSIVRHNVRATINPQMQDDTVLLGMSFMKDLELIQKGERLTLRQY